MPIIPSEHIEYENISGDTNGRDRKEVSHVGRGLIPEEKDNKAKHDHGDTTKNNR